MITDNIKNLLLGIFIVLLLLGACVTVDYAEDDTIVANNTTLKMPKNTIVVNKSTMFNEEPVKPQHNGKIYTEVAKKVKQKPLPTISMWAKPSVRSGYSYTWHKFTWVDYCPNCRHYNALLKNPKGVAEREYTCKYCDSDFCAVTGKEKYNWSHVYLKRA